MQQDTMFVLTATYGDGHWQVAQALKNRLLEAGVHVRIINLMAEAHPVWDAVIRFLFLQSSKLSLLGVNYYGWSYYGTRTMKRNHPLVRTGFTLGMNTLRKMLLQERPVGVISTFPYFDVAQLCAGVGLNIPTFTVMTDYDLHHRWILSTEDRYYVASDALKQGMVTQNIGEEQIVVSGIPLREPFASAQERHMNRLALGLDPHKRVTLLMSGGYGVGWSVDKGLRLLRRIPEHQVLVVCGKNEKLFQELQQQYDQTPDIHLFRYVEDIAQLMSCADAVVTKAGGVTVSEAMSLQVPLFICRPQPGQELENARFLAAQGVAKVAKHEAELVQQMEAAYKQPTQLQFMRDSMVSMSRPHAAAAVVHDMLETLQRHQSFRS
ncbi:glycosyltransferase [Paenibacillus sp. ACRRX]|uniref:MGDG synthase family glycosyltransferase n=1 Tax=unclassified Paenibacillus TaxID=185978 RepID=UPI001EF452F5|nr:MULTISPECIES: glycosyltransferase [unclassified Paenibacillus]MCG7405787.1 glycosyltransferase [Paenibacillus sp. ACRRX]MDK8182232.1 glycosyltransferase [Paenibacillus sp. UMB4589-SE434]